MKDCMIGVVVDADTKKAFEMLAESRRMSVSALVLHLAMMGLDKLAERTRQLQQIREHIAKESTKI